MKAPGGGVAGNEFGGYICVFHTGRNGFGTFVFRHDVGNKAREQCAREGQQLEGPLTPSFGIDQSEASVISTSTPVQPPSLSFLPSTSDSPGVRFPFTRHP